MLCIKTVWVSTFSFGMYSSFQYWCWLDYIQNIVIGPPPEHQSNTAVDFNLSVSSASTMTTTIVTTSHQQNVKEWFLWSFVHASSMGLTNLWMSQNYDIHTESKIVCTKIVKSQKCEWTCPKMFWHNLDDLDIAKQPHKMSQHHTTGNATIIQNHPNEM